MSKSDSDSPDRKGPDQERPDQGGPDQEGAEQEGAEQEGAGGTAQGVDLSGALEVVEAAVLGEAPSLTRAQVAEQAGMPLEVAKELWRLMGFAHLEDDDKAFTPGDVKALRLAQELTELGILTPERQAALVRTWGRSFARLAEWQTNLLTTVALDSMNDETTPADTLGRLTDEVLPRVEALQGYVWRRHLVAASNRALAVESPGTPVRPQAVVFVDIVGYTSQSKNLSESELVEWLERFESDTLDLVVEHGGRIIKNIGDEVLFVCDDPEAAVATAVQMVQRGSEEADPFPAVRAGMAYGDVVDRLGDVFGPVVNIAARLTSVARPGTVVVDEGMHDALTGDSSEEDSAYSLRRLRRVSVKGYTRLPAWALTQR